MGALADLLNERIDAEVTDERSRSSIIAEMAEAAGIDSGTVNEILNNSIKCPPDERLRGFAEVLDVSFEALKDAKSSDGCETESEEAAEGEGESNSGGDEGESNQAQHYYAPLTLSALAASGDSDRREYGVTFISAGRVLRRDGKEANWIIPADTLRSAVSKLESLSVFVDHPGWFDNPSVRNLAAVTFQPEFNETLESIDGGIRLYGRDDMAWLRTLLDQVVADRLAGRETPNLGLSLVFFGQHDWSDGPSGPFRITTSIDYIESCDIVFSPGAEGRVREILSSANVQVPAERSLERSTIDPDVAGRSTESSERSQLIYGGVVMFCPMCGVKLQAGGEHRCSPAQTQVVEGVSAPAPAPAPVLASPPSSPGTAIGAPVNGNNDVQIQLAELGSQMNRLVQALGQQEEPNVVAGMGQAPRPHSMQTDLDRFAPAVDWLFGVQDAPLPDPQYRRSDMIYVALTGDYEWRGVFDPDRVMLGSANTTTLANLAVNAMNKIILEQFSLLTFWRWYEQITTVSPNDGSLHDMQWITYGGVGNLPTIAEGGPYTELVVDDVKEADSFTKKGGYVGITRKMMKNSDIQRIQAVPRSLAISAVRTRSAAVSNLFTTASGVGPTLDQDSTALFHADHSNVGTTAFAAAEWRVVRHSIFQHTEVNSSKVLGVFPRFALLPPELYDTALVAFGFGEGMPTTYTPEAENRGLEDPRPTPLAVPDWTDANDWAAVVDPRIYPVVMITYSQSPGGGTHPAPELFAAMSETGGLMFSNDTLPIKVRDEFAVGVNSYRGIYKENVA